MATPVSPLHRAGYVLALGALAVGLGLVVTRRAPSQPVRLQAPPSPAPVRVHVTGEVAQPGVYALPLGSIVQDAVDAAGGASSQADLQALNLARLLADGDAVRVPARLPTPLPGTTGAAPGRAPAGQPVNINTATAPELETLPHIGPALAERIVSYRTEHGLFARPEDIMDVPGIGPAIYAEIKDLITV